MRILYLSRWYPLPADNGAKLRTVNVLRQLTHEHEVSLISCVDPREQPDLSRETGPGQFCSNVQALPYREFQPTSRRALSGLFSMQPRYLVDVHSEAFSAAVDAHLAAHHVDLVIGGTLGMLPYLLRAKDHPLMLDELELSAFRDQVAKAGSPLGRARRWLMWTKLSRYLRQTLPRLGAVTVVSEAERRNVAEVAPGYRSVHVVPNAVDMRSYADDYGPREANAMVFAGALTYSLNYEGARWLLGNVMPAVAAQNPQARLRITGSLTGVDVDALPHVDGCELTGYVPDVHAVIGRSSVSVVPLLSGGGTRLKILESMALGTPVISTTKGAEGLAVTDGENILLADDPSEFAVSIQAVMGDARLWARLSEGGRALVRSRYDWDAVGADLRRIASGAAGQTTPRMAEARA